MIYSTRSQAGPDRGSDHTDNRLIHLFHMYPCIQQFALYIARCIQAIVRQGKKTPIPTITQKSSMVLCTFDQHQELSKVSPVKA